VTTVMGLDQHRAQITADWLTTETGEIGRARVASLRGSTRRAKTDRADARHLRKLLMVGRLPEAWIPPGHLLDLRARVQSSITPMHRGRLPAFAAATLTRWPAQKDRAAATLTRAGAPHQPSRHRPAAWPDRGPR
jgi:hypothetical protein